jgi:hypothetical protein
MDFKCSYFPYDYIVVQLLNRFWYGTSFYVIVHCGSRKCFISIKLGWCQSGRCPCMQRLPGEIARDVLADSLGINFQAYVSNGVLVNEPPDPVCNILQLALSPKAEYERQALRAAE